MSQRIQTMNRTSRASGPSSFVEQRTDVTP
jgi:hypothetical protein